jgi:micrococcal nuclease
LRKRTSPVWARRKRSRRAVAGFLLTVLVVVGLAGLSLVTAGPEDTPFEIRHLWTDDAREAEENQIAGIHFTPCERPPFANCVIDGDTFYLERQSIRLFDIDTPELNPSRCALEARLGAEAKARLLELLNAGPFSLEAEGTRDEDQYGRQLRSPVREGRSFGDILASEGLARKWTGRRLPWCE